MKTITYIAEPDDSRCRWFSADITEVKIEDLEGYADFKYYKRGADLEIPEGNMIVDWEEIHHRKNRGYRVNIGMAIDEEVVFFAPQLIHKMYIKKQGRQDLMKGSGNVTACIRIALYLNGIEDIQERIEEFKKLKCLTDGE